MFCCEMQCFCSLERGKLKEHFSNTPGLEWFSPFVFIAISYLLLFVVNLEELGSIQRKIDVLIKTSKNI